MGWGIRAVPPGIDDPGLLAKFQPRKPEADDAPALLTDQLRFAHLACLMSALVGAWPEPPDAGVPQVPAIGI